MDRHQLKSINFNLVHLDRKLSSCQFNPQPLSNSFKGMLGSAVEMSVLPSGHLTAPHAQYVDNVTSCSLVLRCHVGNGKLGAQCGRQ